MDGLVSRLNSRSCDKISYFNRKCAVDALTGLTLLSESMPDSPPPHKSPVSATTPYSTSMKTYGCIQCKMQFNDVAEMKAHYKSKSHIDTITRGKTRPEPRTDALLSFSDTSSSSTSESDSEDPSESSHSPEKNRCSTQPAQNCSQNHHGKPMVFFRNRNKDIVGIYRCLLYSKENRPATFNELLSRVNLLRTSRLWAFLLYSGGKFAGAVFDEDRVLVHKTFHRYTVRAKQGGGQSARDAASGGMGGPKSAGAALRRHGEAHIRSDISNLLHVRWRSLLQACQFVLAWTPEVHRHIFTTPPSSATTTTTTSTAVVDNSDNDDSEGAGNAPDELARLSALHTPDRHAEQAVAARMGVVKGDPRLRRLPCRARNITFACVKDLQSDFSHFKVFESYADPEVIELSERRLIERGEKTIFESASGRVFQGTAEDFGLTPRERRTPRQRRHRNRGRRRKKTADSDDGGEVDAGDDDDGGGSEMSERRADEWMKPRTDKRRSSNAEASSAPKGSSLLETYRSWHVSLRYAVLMNEIETTNFLLFASQSSPDFGLLKHKLCARLELGNWPQTEAQKLDLVNHRFDGDRTLLHLAVETHNVVEIITSLLKAGCRPDAKDAEGRTPFQLARDLHKKDVVTAFKAYREKHPDQYDYVKAGFTIAEAKKTASVRQRKSNPATVKPEVAAVNSTSQKLANMSIREKRVQEASAQKPLVACDECSADLAGMEPFTYLNFKFCSTRCLRSHRLANKKS